MTEYLMGLKEIWMILLGRKKKQKKSPVPIPPTPQIDDSAEIAQLQEEILGLKTALLDSLNTLREWERVNKQMLYPHQHNTGTINKETISKIEKVL